MSMKLYAHPDNYKTKKASRLSPWYAVVRFLSQMVASQALIAAQYVGLEVAVGTDFS